jgi:hypothetical protein
MRYARCSREGQEEQSRCFTRVFFSFQEDYVPSMNTGPFGHVAISKHRLLFTQTRQGLN